MGKRSNFERKERDLYPTPAAAVFPLLPHLRRRTRFVEPCAGDGRMIDALEAGGMRCAGAFDVEPLRADIRPADALRLRPWDVPRGAMIITNPPWKREILHPMIALFASIAPTWLLFDADWAHTDQALAFKWRLQRVVSVGRVKWEPESDNTGVDNSAWHLFGDVPSVTAWFHRDEPAPPPEWRIPA